MRAARVDAGLTRGEGAFRPWPEGIQRHIEIIIKSNDKEWIFMKFLTSLPMKLLLGVIAGIAVGQFAGVALMNVVVTVRYILGQLILFCVPLIIIGFIAPSITRLGNNASKMLGVAVTIAYISSIARRSSRWPPATS